MNFQELTTKYPEFTYVSFEYAVSDNHLHITFHFSIQSDLHFAPTITIPLSDKPLPPNFDNLIFHLGLVEMLSYWKLTCSPRITINAGHLDQDQINWWHNLLTQSMGEYFYNNHIDFTRNDLVSITVDSPATERSVLTRSGDTPLVLAAGGKDTAVTLGLMTENHHKFGTLLVNPTPAALDLCQISGQPHPIIVERQLDPHLLELNQQGFLNGHTPFSALLAFLGITTAHLYGFGSVLVSNERSSNEGNVEYLGHQINHQYSKTFTFETDFRQYLNQYLIKDLKFISFLRPLYELQIAKIFATLPQYWSKFRSCNTGQTTNSWCGHCPKCLFTYACLYPFIDTPDLISIFGHDLFQDISLYPFAEQLIDPSKAKPFECVGTREEATAAFHLSFTKTQSTGSVPQLLVQIHDHHLVSAADLESKAKSLLSGWNSDNYLSEQYQSIIKTALS